MKNTIAVVVLAPMSKKKTHNPQENSFKIKCKGPQTLQISQEIQQQELIGPLIEH